MICPNSFQRMSLEDKSSVHCVGTLADTVKTMYRKHEITPEGKRDLSKTPRHYITRHLQSTCLCLCKHYDYSHRYFLIPFLTRIEYHSTISKFVLTVRSVPQTRTCVISNSSIHHWPMRVLTTTKGIFTPRWHVASGTWQITRKLWHRSGTSQVARGRWHGSFHTEVARGRWRGSFHTEVARHKCHVTDDTESFTQKWHVARGRWRGIFQKH